MGPYRIYRRLNTARVIGALVNPTVTSQRTGAAVPAVCPIHG